MEFERGRRREQRGQPRDPSAAALGRHARPHVPLHADGGRRGREGEVDEHVQPDAVGGRGAAANARAGLVRQSHLLPVDGNCR